jgi:hypothetical protein
MSASTTSDLGTMPASRWRVLNALCTAHQRTKPWVPLADVLRPDSLEALLDLEERALVAVQLEGGTPVSLTGVGDLGPPPPRVVRTMQVRITSTGVKVALDTHSNLVIRVLGPRGNAGRQIRWVLHEASVGFEVLVAMQGAGLLELTNQPDVPLESYRNLSYHGLTAVMVRLTPAGRRYWPRGA